MDSIELIGLTLDDAGVRLAENPGVVPLVVTTVPPFDPKYRVPVWGELRVIRAKEKDGTVELLVARELLAEELLAEPTGGRPGRKRGKNRPPKAE